MNKKTKTPPIDREALGKLPPLREPTGVLIERGSPPRGEVTITNDGLGYVEYLASEFCTQGFAASKLGVSLATFRKLYGKDVDDPPSPLRAAWESGRAAFETEVQRYHLLAMRKGSAIQPMFISKTEFGKREAGAAIEIQNGPRIDIVLPGSMSEAEYYKRLGIAGPIDTRAPKKIAESEAIRRIGMHDVSPLPTQPVIDSPDEQLPAPVRPPWRPEHGPQPEQKS